ncbi:chaplin [Streptomyces sp. NPDC020489]|uniref:chaplin n=1 Tax=Streptomyces sp. NPDC020489 TaxID=3365077 RepID=UPI0037AD4E3B
MRQTLSRGMVAAAAATSILSLCGSSPAFADSDADGGAKGSPGVLSGNSVQAPIDVPVNACGNSVDPVGALNPTFGNSCAHDSGSPRSGASYGDDSGHGGGSHGSSGHGAHHACGSMTDVGGSYGDDCGTGGHEESPGYGDTPTPTPTTPGPTPTKPTPTHTPPNGGEHTPTPTPTPTPPGGGDHTPTPTHTPPGGGEHTPTPSPTHTPPGGGEHTPTPTPTSSVSTPPPGPHGPPPQLPETGSGETMAAAAIGSAVMITAGAVLYRRGRKQAAAHL